MFGAGDLRGFAEYAKNTLRDELVVHVAHGRARGEAGGRVGLAALGGYPQIGDRAFLAGELGGPLQKILGRARRLGDGAEIAGALDAEAGDRLAGRRDAVDDAPGPAVLDADHHHRRDVRVGAGADQGAEEQVEVGAELQPPVGVRQRQGALDVVRHRFARRVGEIVERKDDDVVAHAGAAVLAPPANEASVAVPGHLAHQRLVLRLCTCTSALTSCTIRPMSWPYLIAVSPALRSVSATLWPIGMSCLTDIVKALLSSVTTPNASVPALRPSTVTTATLSLGLWASTCGMRLAAGAGGFAAAIAGLFMGRRPPRPAATGRLRAQYWRVAPDVATS